MNGTQVERTFADGSLESRRGLLLLVVLTQALLPSVVYSYLVHVPTLVPSAFALLVVTSLTAQWLLRSAYLALFIAGILLWWNLTPPDYLFYLGFLKPDDIPLPAGVLVAFIVAALIFSLPLVRERAPTMRLRVVVACAALALVALKLTPLNTERSLVGVHLKEPTLRFFAWAAQTLGPGAARYAGHGDSSRGYGAGTPYAPAHSFSAWLRQETLDAHSLALLMVESWAEEPAQLEEIRRRLAAMGVHVHAWGYTDAYGGTLEAEVRELCGSYADLTESVRSGKLLDGCVPWELQRRGYRTVALHGYKGEFYLRNIVWPRMGLSELRFKKDFVSEKLCLGTFLGVCDSTLLNFAFERLAQPEPTFVHVLTLNSHEPMPSKLIDQPCAGFGDMTTTGLVQAQARRVLCYLAEKMLAGPYVRPVSVYVVGDHPPPLSRGLSEQTSRQVPYLVVSTMPERGSNSRADAVQQ